MLFSGFCKCCTQVNHFHFYAIAIQMLKNVQEKFNQYLKILLNNGVVTVKKDLQSRK